MAATTAIIVSAAVSAYTAHEEHKIKKEAAAAEDRRNEEEKAFKEQEIAKKNEIFKSEKKNLLKVRLATQRANMGASGLSATSKSSNALMGAIEKDVDEQMKANEFFTDLDLKNLNSLYNYKKAKNLLGLESSRLSRNKSYFDTGMDAYNDILKVNG